MSVLMNGVRVYVCDLIWGVRSFISVQQASVPEIKAAGMHVALYVYVDPCMRSMKKRNHALDTVSGTI